ncbi:MAG: CoA-binding protein [Deltaproteobacteria bacterium]|jgi:predicted CoA-binding protein|nr:CoA-binding protein [Deltaproteobacteria bacterium]
MENVAVVGASPKADRYSNQAMRMLEENGHNPIPIAPAKDEILNRKAYPSLRAVPDRVDTVTMYVGPSRQAPVLEDVIRIRPRRIIFNPGSENPEEYDRLRSTGIEVVEACTLVMLRTGQF